MKKFTLLLALLPVLSTFAQNEINLTLPEAIALARKQSVDATVALNELKTAYWTYRTYRADLLPEVNLTGTLPGYNNRYNSYQQSDGSYTFVRNNAISLDGTLSIDQNIWLTGGKLSLTSSLEYLHQLGNNGYEQYMSVPIGLELTQPLFAANPIKWNRRIEPVRYAEAKAAFISATEKVTINTISYFFNLLLSKATLATAHQNLENASRLYEVAQAKRRMGQISENDLLQLKLTDLQAKAALTEAQSNLNAQMFQLRAFLGLSEDVTLNPVVPESLPALDIAYQSVLDKALERNSFAHNILRRQLEAEYAVATAKGKLREVNLFASIGYSGQDVTLPAAYRTLRSSSMVSVGITLPLVDWGKRKGQVKVAESNREVVQSRIRQEQINFNQDIFLLVEHYNNQTRQVQIAEEADKIAQKRYDTNVATFMIGQISTLELNDAQKVKDAARQQYIVQMYYYWNYYYQIRSLTLWDFATNAPLEVDFEDVVRS